MIQLNAESFDLGNDFDASTHRFTAPRTGYYQVNAGVLYTSLGTDIDTIVTAIEKNGTAPWVVAKESSRQDEVVHTIADIMYLNANDYIELFNDYSGPTGAAVTIYGNSYGIYTYLSVSQLL